MKFLWTTADWKDEVQHFFCLNLLEAWNILEKNDFHVVSASFDILATCLWVPSKSSLFNFCFPFADFFRLPRKQSINFRKSAGKSALATAKYYSAPHKKPCDQTTKRRIFRWFFVWDWRIQKGFMGEMMMESHRKGTGEPFIFRQPILVKILHPTTTQELDREAVGGPSWTFGFWTPSGAVLWAGMIGMGRIRHKITRMVARLNWRCFIFGGFQSHGGTPIAGWFLLGKIPSRNGWFGVPLF